ncbi:GDSL-like Lipase/Acylhydrolase family [Rhodospirillales bacterium URHD0017]|nr:GDSL-like Lipase/Acylhydrolase family [Rhodospirillales bacterium URHD0017]
MLVSLLLAIAVAGVAWHFWWRGDLPPGMPRRWYFYYLGALLLAGMAVAPWPRLAMVVLSLAALEIGFGIGGRVFERLGLSETSLLPANEWADMRFTWHPLLQAVPIPTPPEESNPHMRHNSRKLRGQERTPESLAGKKVVALFGGSTTYDQGNGDGDSWPERLEALLGPSRHAVINHGMGGYASAEHVIQTAFYESAFGRRPDCAIYYMGWNDAHNAHIANLDPGYADFHLPGQVDGEEARRIGGQAYSISPTLFYLTRLVVLAFDTVRPPTWPTGPMRSAPDPALEAIYARNIATISAINRQRGIRTIWVGQLLNVELLATKPSSSPWVQGVHSRDLWAMVERLNDAMRREAEKLGDVYIPVAIDTFGPGDFVDEGHFNAQGALKFATAIAPQVAEACP